MHTYHRNKMMLHPGSARMYQTMRPDYYWPGMKDHIGKYVDGCLACRKTKRGIAMSAGDSFRVVPEFPFQIVGLDIKGPLPQTSGKDAADSGYVDQKHHYYNMASQTPVIQARELTRNQLPHH